MLLKFDHVDHLGPHTFVSEDHHGNGHHWLTHFGRIERHQMVEEDRRARTFVSGLVFLCMGGGLLATIATVCWIALA